MFLSHAGLRLLRPSMPQLIHRTLVVVPPHSAIPHSLNSLCTYNQMLPKNQTWLCSSCHIYNVDSSETVFANILHHLLYVLISNHGNTPPTYPCVQAAGSTAAPPVHHTYKSLSMLPLCTLLVSGRYTASAFWINAVCHHCKLPAA